MFHSRTQSLSRSRLFFKTTIFMGMLSAAFTFVAVVISIGLLLNGKVAFSAVMGGTIHRPRVTVAWRLCIKSTIMPGLITIKDFYDTVRNSRETTQKLTGDCYPRSPVIVTLVSERRVLRRSKRPLCYCIKDRVLFPLRRDGEEKGT